MNFAGIWLDGSMYGLQVFPKYSSAAAAAQGLMQTQNVTFLGWMIFLILATYSFAFVVIIPFLLQEFASLAVKGVCDMWFSFARKI
jgi:hypothetical protein